MGKLIDIDVERVDGVDLPATRRGFVIKKSAVLSDDVATGDDAAFQENVRTLANSSSAFLKALAEAGSEFPLSEDMAAAANEMAKSLGIEVEYKAMPPQLMKKPAADDDNDAEDQAEGPGPDDDNDAEDQAEAEAAKKKPPMMANKDVAGASVQDIATAVAGALAPMIKSQNEILKSLKAMVDEPDPISKSLGRSKQVRRQGVTKSEETELGKGVFEDVIFGN